MSKKKGISILSGGLDSVVATSVYADDYDLVIGPTTTTTAYNLDCDLDNPLKSFLDDVLVIPVNMAGLPAISVPIGFDKEHMPIGLHIIGKHFDEATIYKLASFIEKELNLDLTPGGGACTK